MCSNEGRHLETLLDLIGKPHTGARVGGQVDDGQALFQGMHCGRLEHGIFLGAKAAQVEGDVVGHGNHLQQCSGLRV